MPTCDNNPRYTGSPTGPQKRQIEHANVVQAKTTSALRSYTEVLTTPDACADAAKSKCICEGNTCAIERQKVHKGAACPKEQKGEKKVSVFSRTHNNGKTQKNLPHAIVQAVTHDEDSRDPVPTPAKTCASSCMALAIIAKRTLEASDKMTPQGCKSNEDISTKPQVMDQSLTYANQHQQDPKTLNLS
ncbi:hypothetical protein BJV78DRAFT_1287122 [Lactifluus subvellereus]|nr:hypothetical protein BJV78DRAFT_1287122 [Lactifluus subvellereus]